MSISQRFSHVNNITYAIYRIAGIYYEKKFCESNIEDIWIKKMYASFKFCPDCKIKTRNKFLVYGRMSPHIAGNSVRVNA